MRPFTHKDRTLEDSSPACALRALITESRMVSLSSLQAVGELNQTKARH